MVVIWVLYSFIKFQKTRKLHKYNIKTSDNNIDIIVSVLLRGFPFLSVIIAMVLRLSDLSMYFIEDNNQS